MTAQLIGITGATGGLGGRVAARLAAAGVPQRLIVRDASRAPQLDGAEVRVAAGYGHPEELRAALAGAHTLLLVSAGESEDRVDQHRAAVGAAADAGVQRIVYTSFVAATADSTFTLGRDHHHTEEAIRASGVAHTFLRDNLYADFIPGMVGPDGVLRGPAGKGRVAAVARDDIADAAVTVLTGSGHDGRAYDLTGPEAFTLREAAELMAEWSGRPIRFHNEDVQEAYESRMDPDIPDFILDAWVTTYLAIKKGELETVSGAVQELTGHAPIGLREVLERYPGSLDHVTGT
jgi:NAD(P)H dehydrogenase (quinone)